MSEAPASAPAVIQQSTKSQSSSSSSVTSSPSNSLSIIKLDELSSYGALKQNRLPTLIKMNDIEQQQQQQMCSKQAAPISMPAFSAHQLEQAAAVLAGKQQVSLPANINQQPIGSGNKENSMVHSIVGGVDADQDASCEDYQMIDMTSTDLMGPSLPAAPITQQNKTGTTEANAPAPSSLTSVAQKILSSNQNLNQQSSYLGDSLIEMIINLRNENQNLVKALETNNDYVKERLNEFKRFNEEAKKREAHFAAERAEHEHQVRKLKRQNTVLSDRLKSMEAKLKDMRLEVGDTLDAANSSKASSTRGEDNTTALYPALDASMESFGNSALNGATTMQVDAVENNGEPTSVEKNPATANRTEPKSVQFDDEELVAGTANPMNNPLRFGKMSQEELSKRFDADKAAFYAMDDPMKQCDKLEQQLNDIGRRDYEICLLQQQLNIYRQDFRLERMANLEAKIQIEKLKNDIDRLCFERMDEKNNRNHQTTSTSDEESPPRASNIHRGSHHRHSASAGIRFDAASAAADAVSKLGLHLSKRASRSAAKAAKFASKQAYREEKAAAASAAAAAAAAQAAAQAAQAGASESSHHHHHHRRGHHHHRSSAGGPMRGLRNEVVNDLLSTANKAMLTGYKMASTHVNLAIDKLSQFEQAQAANLEKNKTTPTSSNKSTTPSAPPMNTPSLD